MEDRCIVCVGAIPEGRMVCPACSGELEEKEKERVSYQKLLGMSCIKGKKNSRAKEY